MMPTPAVTEAQIKRVVDRYSQFAHLKISEAARKMGMKRETLRHYLNVYAPRFGFDVASPTNGYTVNQRASQKRAMREPIIAATHEYPELPDDDLDGEEIIEIRKREFAQKMAHEEAYKLIPVKIKIDGPIGIAHMGDPHLDDDGTDIGEVFRIAEFTAKVDGLQQIIERRRSAEFITPIPNPKKRKGSTQQMALSTIYRLLSQSTKVKLYLDYIRTLLLQFLWSPTQE